MHVNSLQLYKVIKYCLQWNKTFIFFIIQAVIYLVAFPSINVHRRTIEKQNEKYRFNEQVNSILSV